ncbi:MAG: D-alanyl-D-alanine carboxypeptidase/D-alanyl-D-alanine-endopeptidase [Bacteroidales bacterium]|nr:D-alanyl-D-alanine carboxypeptidase/D-alanyl-D-alanine-endopeptidase [Bacteroidales bacterium]
MNILFGIILQSIIAAFAITESGEVLADINSEQMLVPASNMKVITTGTALNRLGGDYRWETGIGYSGTVSDGVLHGDLYIIGGADPTLGSPVSFAYPIEETFSKWTEFIRDAGIQKIEGSIIGDGRYIEGPMEDPTWLWEDLGTYYGTGVNGLSFFENRKDFRVGPGSTVGSPVRIEDSYPKTPWMEYSYDCTTGNKNTGDQLYLYTTRLAPVGSITGTFALEKAQKVLMCSNKYPEYTCACLFREYLEKAGISSGGAADIGTCFGIDKDRIVAQDKLTIIGKTKSPNLAKVVRETNFESNNFMAETLFRTLGKVVSGKGDFESSRNAMNSELRKMGVGTAGRAQIKDGSGLSRGNYVSPQFFCAFLKAMTKTKEYPVFLESLPVVGRSGTVRTRLPNVADSQKIRVRMKSGSMDGVRCYCGYILPSGSAVSAGNGSTVSGQTVIFSFMINNSTASTAEQNAAADKFITGLIR